MANVVGVNPIRWSTRLGMTELKNASSTRCADADAGTNNKPATTPSKMRIQKSRPMRRVAVNSLAQGAVPSARCPRPDEPAGGRHRYGWVVESVKVTLAL